ncbi:hypothetical protein P2H44_22260 [Albimonas sp. CAU 1670]|uniref:hypothetical protein n=1 Tax=Albimonas sp. CAU 1670 TaxID=3032599 RepID=UPI0023DB6A02|nr:hypothetical protein [Albimonas sp. CAU 1670]MDF2235292.1 hypothetical protein [Albimonas sp. CAU 1670]
MMWGCDSQKALAARFREADPNTDFDVARSYKWIQGRAAPRSAKLYEEWARLLDVGRPGAWLAACDLGAFVATLETRHGPAAAGLREAAGLAPEPASAGEPHAFLPGRFALYGLAQSPYYEDRMIRGDLQISPGLEGEPGHRVRVRESFAGIDAVWTGAVEPHAQGVSGELRNEGGVFGPCYLALIAPTLPASLLTGMMVGFVSLQPGAQRPYATRFAAVRVPPAAVETLVASNRYLGVQEPIADDLRALGLPVDDEPGFAEALERWLRSPVAPAALAPAEMTELVAGADRLWLATL